MKPYPTLYQRLVSSVDTPANEQRCWLWNKARNDRGYPTLNVRAPNGSHKQIRAHRAILVLLELEGETEHFWDLYWLYSAAELEADHLCSESPACINPDHLQWLHKDDHKRVTQERVQGIHKRWR